MTTVEPGTDSYKGWTVKWKPGTDWRVRGSCETRFKSKWM